MALVRSRRRPDGGYRPPLLHRLLEPAVSGNTVNGLGERQPRRPSPLYHHQQVPLAHARMQRAFYLRLLLNPAYWRRFRDVSRLASAPQGAPAPERAEPPAEGWAAAVRRQALQRGAAAVGVARMREEWVFEGYEVTEPWIVLLAVPMDHATMMRMAEHGVDTRAGTHVIDVYNHGNRVARALAGWIREQGWPATGSCGPMAGPVNLIPAALAAGLGELGKHGSIIHPELGSMFRLAYVLTSMPLAEDAPRSFGADAFCHACQLCEKSCPPRAINHDKQWVRGVQKWYVDFDRCVPYFNDAQGCGICIAVCPWSRPGVAPRLAEKMRRRAADR